MSDSTFALNFIALFLLIVFFLSLFLILKRAWTEDVVDWYKEFIADYIMIPKIAFLVIWVILFGLLIASGYLVWQLRLNEEVIAGELVIVDQIGKDQAYTAAMSLWLISIFLAAIWVPVFFRSRNLVGAICALVIIFLDVMVSLACMALFYVLWWVPGLLYTPFFLWLIVVTFLNGAGIYAIEKARVSQNLGWFGVAKVSHSRSSSYGVRYI